MSILGLLVGCRSIIKKKKKKDNILLFLFFTTTVISRFSRQSERNRCVHTLCVHHFLAFLLARQAKRTERASCLSTRSRTFDPPAYRPTERLQLHSSVSSVKRKQLLLVTAVQNWRHPLPKSKLYL